MTAREQTQHLAAAARALERELTMRLEGRTQMDWMFMEPAQLQDIIEEAMSDPAMTAQDIDIARWHQLRGAAISAAAALNAGRQAGERQAHFTQLGGVPVSLGEVIQLGRRHGASHYQTPGEATWFCVGWVQGWMNRPGAIDADLPAETAIGATGLRVYPPDSQN